MCLKTKVHTTDQIREEQKDSEVIKNAVRANAATQKASPENRIGKRGFISDNIRTSNSGLEDEIVSSKKKLLGE